MNQYIQKMKEIVEGAKSGLDEVVDFINDGTYEGKRLARNLEMSMLYFEGILQDIKKYTEPPINATIIKSSDGKEVIVDDNGNIILELHDYESVEYFFNGKWHDASITEIDNTAKVRTGARKKENSKRVLNVYFDEELPLEVGMKVRIRKHTLEGSSLENDNE